MNTCGTQKSAIAFVSVYEKCPRSVAANSFAGSRIGRAICRKVNAASSSVDRANSAVSRKIASSRGRAAGRDHELKEIGARDRSGIEVEPGHKDGARMQQFVDEVRRADQRSSE